MSGFDKTLNIFVKMIIFTYFSLKMIKSLSNQFGCLIGWTIYTYSREPREDFLFLVLFIF